ncbi:MAG: ImmA/IrrE family metallo-endopeptidase [Candidatus Ornithomonoglobus sp.]
MYSNNYSDYKKARDLAWKILIKFKVSSLPVNIFDICHNVGVRIYTYRENQELIKAYKLSRYALSNDGFSITINNHYAIFYNDTIVPYSRTKFTLAHELGHILLGHITDNGVVTRWNVGEEVPPDPQETAANQFAARLLAPACVLYELNVQTVSELMSLTGLSYTAAEYRLKRLNELRERNKFYMSALERQVRHQFEDFITEHK